MMIIKNKTLYKVLFGISLVVFGIKTIYIVDFLINKEFFNNVYNQVTLLNMEVPEPGSRILLFEPHPDDVILGCGAFLTEALKNGCKIQIVLITNGDGIGLIDKIKYHLTRPKPAYFEKMAYKRQQEAIKAYSTLGLSAENIIFLGFPDRGSLELWKNYWDRDQPYTSPFTKQNYTYYANAYSPKTPYTGVNMVNLIKKIVTEYNPTHIIYPHFYDRHVDHFAANNFVKYTIAKMGLSVKEFTYLVHRGNWPSPFGNFPNLKLIPPKALGSTDLNWYSFKVTPETLLKKEASLRAYQSQAANPLMKYYLLSFVRQNELFSEYNDLELNVEPNQTQSQISIINPFSDILLGYVNRPADIKELTITLSENHLIYRIYTIKKPHHDYQYLLSLTFFDDQNTTKRAFFCVENQQLQLNQLTDNSITTPQQLSLITGNNYLEISMSLEEIPNLNSLLINASTYKKAELIDRTGLRRIIINRGMTN